jgi:hypothetical protein
MPEIPGCRLGTAGDPAFRDLKIIVDNNKPMYIIIGIRRA